MTRSRHHNPTRDGGRRRGAASRGPSARGEEADRGAAPAGRRWKTTAGTIAIPAILAVAVFCSTLPNGVVYDDEWTLDRVPTASSSSVWSLLRTPRGLTYLTHMADRSLWESIGWGRHLTNVILHAIATAAAAGLSYRLTSSRRIGLICGMLFAVHPVHVEAVALVSYRKDILAMIFVALTLLLWLRGPLAWLRYPAAAMGLICALLSKEVAAIGVVPLLLLADLLHERGRSGAASSRGARLRRALLRSAPLLAVAAVAAVWFVNNVSLASKLEAIRHESTWQISTYGEVAATAAGAVPEVARLLVWPFTLCVDYPMAVQSSLFTPRAMAGMAIVAVWSVVATVLVRRSPIAAFAMGWTLLMYLPCSNVVPLTHFFVAERYLYVPSFGICLLLALLSSWLLVRASRCRLGWPRIAAAGFVAALVVLGGARCLTRNRDWRDNHSLWSSALRDGFETRRIHGNLAKHLMSQARHEEALPHYARAFELHACTQEAEQYAHALGRSGRWRQAGRLCRFILDAAPDHAYAREVLAYVAHREAEEAAKR